MIGVPSDLISQRILYFADDSNIPSNPREKQVFLAAARNTLLDQVVVYTRMISNLMAENETLRSQIRSA